MRRLPHRAFRDSLSKVNYRGGGGGGGEVLTLTYRSLGYLGKRTTLLGDDSCDSFTREFLYSQGGGNKSGGKNFLINQVKKKKGGRRERDGRIHFYFSQKNRGTGKS